MPHKHTRIQTYSILTHEHTAHSLTNILAHWQTNICILVCLYVWSVEYADGCGYVQVKTGPFGEHSSTLYGISAVREWKKVNSGLVKMFKAEVNEWACLLVLGHRGIC